MGFVLDRSDQGTRKNQTAATAVERTSAVPMKLPMIASRIRLSYGAAEPLFDPVAAFVAGSDFRLSLPASPFGCFSSRSVVQPPPRVSLWVTLSTR